MAFGSSAPSLPPETDPAPSEDSEDVEAARRDELRRSQEAGRRGRRATILSGNVTPVANPANTNAVTPQSLVKTILGG